VANLIDVEWVKWIAGMMTPSHWLYNVFYVAFIIFFCYFYTAVTFNPIDVAENVKKQGGYIPGIRPGKATAEHIDTVLSRLTFAGALYISAVCVLPTVLTVKMGVPFFFGGTSLLIVVGVGLDTAAQIEAHLISRSYEGFMKGVTLKGRHG
jgi:preprotein translocase subunit SecY